jgi:hypothetical protein
MNADNKGTIIRIPDMSHLTTIRDLEREEFNLKQANETCALMLKKIEIEKK